MSGRLLGFWNSRLLGGICGRDSEQGWATVLVAFYAFSKDLGPYQVCDRSISIVLGMCCFLGGGEGKGKVDKVIFHLKKLHLINALFLDIIY